jgi:hypothetical protein
MKRVILASLGTLALASCVSHQPTAEPSDQTSSTPPIQVQSGAPQYIFQPVELPGGEDAKFTAQQAYNKMFGKAHQAPQQIPALYTVRYGLLSEDDTVPPADRMPVWAFAYTGGCLRPDLPPPPRGSTAPPTPSASPSRCVQWQFANAATGEGLGVVDQQIIS